MAGLDSEFQALNGRQVGEDGVGDLGDRQAVLDSQRGCVDGGDYTCAEVRNITPQHLMEVRRMIADLRRLNRSLKEMTAKWTGDTVPECPIVDALWRDGNDQD